mgnify:FL=1
MIIAIKYVIVTIKNVIVSIKYVIVTIKNVIVNLYTALFIVARSFPKLFKLLKLNKLSKRLIYKKRFFFFFSSIKYVIVHYAAFSFLLLIN